MAQYKYAMWLSYDLGLTGDLRGLYSFLDELKAVECGTGVAFFKLEIPALDLDGIRKEIRGKLLQHMKISSGEKIYLVYIEESDRNNSGGIFIYGSRQASPWVGYAMMKTGEDTNIDK